MLNGFCAAASSPSLALPPPRAPAPPPGKTGPPASFLPMLGACAGNCIHRYRAPTASGNPQSRQIPSATKTPPTASRPPLPTQRADKSRPPKNPPPRLLQESPPLPQRLRMLRPRPDVPFPLPPQPLFEPRLPPPHRVLPPVVGEDLLRYPVLCNR